MGYMQTIQQLRVARKVFGLGRCDGYEARLALDATTKADAYALRYESYLAYGHIAPHPSKLFSDRFDLLPNCTTIVVYRDGAPVGSVRGCMLKRGTETTSPGREAFQDKVDALLCGSGPDRAGFDGLEVNRLVRSPAAANDQGLVFTLLRLVGRLGLNADFRIAISCVRRNHLPFYRRLNFREESGLRDYPGLNCQMQLLSLSRGAYDDMRAGVVLMDPDAYAPGALDGLEEGRTVQLHPIRRR